jgi:cysteine desulfurase
VREIAEICRERGIIFHTDAAQSAGKCAIDFRETPFDMLSLSGHKLYGPKGVGALIVRPVNRDFELKPILFGGDQEKKLRPGTLNVPGIAGLGRACEIARTAMKDDSARLRRFQTQIMNEILEKFPRVKLNGPREDRLCNNVSFSFSEVCIDDVALGLSGVAFSSGSACNSANASPSHVLKALGMDDTLARTTLRLGLGRFTTPAEVRTVIDKLSKTLTKYSVKALHA